ncbi:unnamed protein product [Spirodela intermedia]|uniref:Enoyl reductase (ER) domain-containing protein n=1 Tax=Spirodela intermedia TaxID=51605 RepID=A0A7I8JEU5_SPIIN|nr:unnamed protein product [Spirodela intermedia]CAA6667922.1 unnamed protein product [Spirodela intermedia]
MAATGGKLMHAVQYEACGGGAAALKLLLKLEAASVNPADWKIQKGLLRPFLPRKFPFSPVTDVAGEVVETGSGVDSLKPGDKVVSILPYSKGGGFAEYAVASASKTVKRPAEVSAADGAGLPMAGLTALQTLKSAGIRFDGGGGGGENAANILVTAASGGVGVYAVQLAKLGKCHVTATCGARNLELVNSLGADEVLDYKSPGGAALESPSGKKYDAVIHCATGIPWSKFEPTLSEKGKVIDITPSGAALLTAAIKKITFSKKQLVPFFFSRRAEELEFLLGLMKEGKLKSVVDSRHPLSQAEAAWAKSVDGHATGKIVVEMGL